MGLVPGVVALNAVFVAVGYALLSAVLPRGSAWSYAGAALVVGASATGVGVFVAAVFGLHVGLFSLFLVAGPLAAAGIAARVVVGGTPVDARRAPLDTAG